MTCLLAAPSAHPSRANEDHSAQVALRLRAYGQRSFSLQHELSSTRSASGRGPRGTDIALTQDMTGFGLYGRHYRQCSRGVEQYQQQRAPRLRHMINYGEESTVVVSGIADAKLEDPEAIFEVDLCTALNSSWTQWPDLVEVR